MVQREYFCFTNDGRPGISIVYWFVQELSGGNRTISAVGHHRHHYQLLTPLLHQFGSRGGRWGLWVSTKKNETPRYHISISVKYSKNQKSYFMSLSIFSDQPLMVTLNLRESWPPLVETLHSHIPPWSMVRRGI